LAKKENYGAKIKFFFLKLICINVNTGLSCGYTTEKNISVDELIFRYSLTKVMRKKTISIILRFESFDTIQVSNSNLFRKKFDISIFAKILQNKFENKCENKYSKTLKKIFKFIC